MIVFPGNDSSRVPGFPLWHVRRSAYPTIRWEFLKIFEGKASFCSRHLNGAVHALLQTDKRNRLLTICCKFAVDFYSRSEYNKGRKGLTSMPNIKPISDLRNYSEVLHEVTVGAPVFLTKNGRGKYAIVDMKDYEKTQAALHLMNELAKGRRSGETEGWLSSEEMREHFRAKADEA